MTRADEFVLTGGNVNSDVRLVEGTVRRSQNKHSDSIHALLDHLQAESYGYSPAYLGIDEKNREILSYIEGEANLTDCFWNSLPLLESTARVLRGYHDATANFAFENYTWARSAADPASHEVVCHHDFAPYNLIVKDNALQGIIDFDLAGPGPRIRDVAYTAYWTVPLSLAAADMREHAEVDIKAESRRLHAFCGHYGIRCDRRLLDEVANVLQEMSSFETTAAAVGESVAKSLKEQGHLDHWQTEHHMFVAAIDRFAAYARTGVPHPQTAGGAGNRGYLSYRAQ